MPLRTPREQPRRSACHCAAHRISYPDRNRTATPAFDRVGIAHGLCDPFACRLLPTRGSLPGLSSTFRFRLEESNRGLRSPGGVVVARHPAQARVVSAEFGERRRAGNGIRNVIVAASGLAQVLIAEVGADSQSARGKPISSGDADDPAPARSRLGACIHRP